MVVVVTLLELVLKVTRRSDCVFLSVFLRYFLVFPNFRLMFLIEKTVFSK